MPPLRDPDSFQQCCVPHWQELVQAVLSHQRKLVCAALPYRWTLPAAALPHRWTLPAAAPNCPDLHWPFHRDADYLHDYNRLPGHRDCGN